MIATMMVPFQCYMIPLYLLMVKIRAVDSYVGLQLHYLVQGLGHVFMRQNFETLPDDYIEAARIEGGLRSFVYSGKSHYRALDRLLEAWLFSFLRLPGVI